MDIIVVNMPEQKKNQVLKQNDILKEVGPYLKSQFF